MIFVTGGRSQGKRAYVREVLGDPADCFFDYQETVRSLLSEGKDPEAYTAQLIAAQPDAVFVMDEVGSGIVPLEKEERIWREACGRCGCLLAARADKVVRLMCGIPMVIKEKTECGSA